MHQNQSLLTAESVISYLVDRGLAGREASAESLGGGVSNVVLAVRTPLRDLVVKQSLPRLRVADEWLAPQDRILTEADALELAANLTPGSVPAVLDRDAECHVIVLEHANRDWTDWKKSLMAGHIDHRVAAELGRVLAGWHARTTDSAGLPASFADTQAFELLRVDPYYRTTASRAGDAGPAILALADEMANRRICFVHGDLSPKNVLIAPHHEETAARCWVIDFEVAHYGDPSFDLAFLLCHLMMKSLHLPQHRDAYDRCADAFMSAYTAGAATLTPDCPYILRHVGCLLLARVRGKSPAEYLTDSQQQAVWRLGLHLLTGSPRQLADLYAWRDDALA